MLKYIAAVLLIVGTSFYVSRQYKQHTQDAAPHSQKPADALPAPHDSKDTKSDVSQPEWHPPSWYRLFGWESLQTWGLFLTLIVIAEQTAETRRSAKAAEVSAQHMVASERPWLIAQMEQTKESCLLDNGNVRFFWKVKNVGKSPARIVEVAARVSLDTLGPRLEPIPDYGQPQPLEKRILVPGDSISFHIIWSVIENGTTRSHLGKTQEEFSDLVIGYGCVTYRDTFSGETLHVTRFCECGDVSNGVVGPYETWVELSPGYIENT